MKNSKQPPVVTPEELKKMPFSKVKNTALEAEWWDLQELAIGDKQSAQELEQMLISIQGESAKGTVLNGK